MENFLLLSRLTATHATKMIAIITGLEKSWKYTSEITKAAMIGSARRSFVLGVNLRYCGSMRRA